MRAGASYLRLVIYTLIVAVGVFVLPTSADAHATLSPASVADDHVDKDDGEAHCHGAIECVVTFNLQKPIEHMPGDTAATKHVTVVGKSLVGVTLGNDPPIPI